MQSGTEYVNQENGHQHSPGFPGAELRGSPANFGSVGQDRISRTDALSEMVSPEAIGQLAMLKVRVRFGTAQKEIEKAFDAAAAALELPRDQIEEMSVPACGLESVGRRDETIGEYRAELTVTCSDADLRWLDARGKLLKSVPSYVKRDSADTLKELQQGLKDVAAMLSAQRDRIYALFLERKSWPEPVWRERYLDHPLVGTIARRLIWCIGETPVTAAGGQAVDIQGKPVEALDGARGHAMASGRPERP
jgi:hypothetical protein